MAERLNNGINGVCVYICVCVYMYVYIACIFFFRLFTIVVYYKILNIVPCAIYIRPCCLFYV